MPDSPQGNHPLNADLVEDALGKAFQAGVRHCFTWNVRQFVLFDSHMPGVPLAQRRIEGPTNVAEAQVSDDVHEGWVEEAIKRFWEDFLRQFGELINGRRAFQPSPLDQRFISWLEGALEGPITHTHAALSRLGETDAVQNGRLNAWMLSQGWELSPYPDERQRNLRRASRLSSYILLTRLVFYQALRRRFRQMSALTTDGIDTPEHLREVLDARFAEAVQYSHDYETIFVPSEDDFGYTIPYLTPTAPQDWARLIERIEEFDLSKLDYDVIGQMYERLISHGERRRYGQFYTSPEVVDLINAFCIRSSSDRVLDPACGGGTFLVRAYSRKQALAGSGGGAPLSHDRIARGDIRYRRGRVSGPTLHDQPCRAPPQRGGELPSCGESQLLRCPGRQPLYKIPRTGDSVWRIALKEVDAVVGNPPYIRQEGINPVDKSSYAGLHRKEWPGQTKLSGRSGHIRLFLQSCCPFPKAGRIPGICHKYRLAGYGLRLQAPRVFPTEFQDHRGH